MRYCSPPLHIKDSDFLHDRSWIWPSVKSIYDELDIAFRLRLSHLLRPVVHIDVISSRLCRYQQNVTRTRDIWVRCEKIAVLSLINRFVILCKNKIMYANWRDKLFMRALEWYFGVYSPCCFAIREINTKITFPWVHKLFATGVHTLFYIYQLSCQGALYVHIRNCSPFILSGAHIIISYLVSVNPVRPTNNKQELPLSLHVSGTQYSHL